MILVPGFAQPASVWSNVVATLNTSIEATALDVPDGLDFEATASALGALGGRSVYVGYSMGGRLALQLALDRPDLVAGLVLVSASPGIADSAARTERAAADARLATTAERDGVVAFLTWWVTQPLFAGLSRDQAAFDDRIAGTSVVRIAHQLTVLGQGAMPPAWHRLVELSMPVLLVTGVLDTKYGEIAIEMRARNPQLDHAVLAGGHVVPLEQPAPLADRISRFVHERIPPGE